MDPEHSGGEESQEEGNEDAKINAHNCVIRKLEALCLYRRCTGELEVTTIGRDINKMCRW